MKVSAPDGVKVSSKRGWGRGVGGEGGGDVLLLGQGVVPLVL